MMSTSICTSTRTYLPSDLTVVKATSAQYSAWQHHAWVNWYKPSGMEEETFVEMVNWQTGEGRHASEGRVVVWVLVPRNDPQTTDVLSACRTMKRDAKVFNRPTGKAASCTSYCITSVVTPINHRRRGYANQLLSILHYLLSPSTTLPSFPSHIYGSPPSRKYQQGDALFSTLWSDVGENFYRLCEIGRGEGKDEKRDGWVVGLTEEMVWELGGDAGEYSVANGVEEDKRDSSTTSALKEELSLITDFQVTLPSTSVESWETSLVESASRLTSYKNKDLFILDSANSPGLINYYLLRQQNKSKHPATNYGFQINTSGGDPKLWAIWTPLEDEGIRTLRITYLGIPDMAHFSRVCSIIKDQAKKMDCTRVTAWGLSAEMRDAWINMGGKVEKRKEHWGAMVWYGSEPVDQVQWVGGEEYTWA